MHWALLTEEIQLVGPTKYTFCLNAWFYTTNTNKNISRLSILHLLSSTK